MASGGFNLLQGNAAAMREMLNGSLAAAQGVAQWLEQSQQLNAQVVETLNQNLNSALREAEQADDVQKLMGVGTNLINRQMGSNMQQFGIGLKQTLETEAQFVERMRNTAMTLSQRVMQGGMAAKPAEVVDNSPMAQLSHAQAEWMALTQRWINSIKTAGHN
ncbi:MAG: hypothetical protein B7Y51_00355 [Burkholderiales bacterium 28-67-8]|nr:MAG: hypothetical protein B7Y51_00355 [Burkholderiales bacterium 28-67-8]